MSRHLPSNENFWLHTFEQCPPISTYIYNLCAGEYIMIQNNDPTAPVPMKVFMRESVKANMDATEMFRVVSSGIRFYEEYTGIKYPWGKYD